MKFENRQVSGDLLVDYDLTLNGMVTGNIQVSNGYKLILNGMCLGGLKIGENSEVAISGTVQGNIENHGGLLKINGIVHGDIADAGVTEVSEGAIVKGSIKKITSNSSSTLAGMVGGAIVANVFFPGFGAALIGGVLGALVGSETSKKEKEDE